MTIQIGSLLIIRVVVLHPNHGAQRPISQSRISGPDTPRYSRLVRGRKEAVERQSGLHGDSWLINETKSDFCSSFSCSSAQSRYSVSQSYSLSDVLFH